MLARKVPVPTIPVGGATITFSLALANRAMKLAQTAAKSFLAEVSDLPAAEAEARLDALADMRAEVAQILAGQDAVTAALTATADVMSGQAFDGTGPLIELAAITRSQLDTARAFDPDLDQPEAEELVDRLRLTAGRLAEDPDTRGKRLRALDDMLRIATEATLALEGSQPARILARHPVTPALDAVLRDLGSLPDADTVRALTVEQIAIRKRAQNNVRHQRQHAAQRELDQTAAAIWETAR